MNGECHERRKPPLPTDTAEAAGFDTYAAVKAFREAGADEGMPERIGLAAGPAGVRVREAQFGGPIYPFASR